MAMTIRPKEFTIKQICKGYLNSDEEGVVAFDGKLNIRPKYQREFVYKENQRDAVIDTILKGYPLNVMYWVKNEDGTYEMLDGQQRTISFCEFMENNFSIKYGKFSSNKRGLPPEVQRRIENYKCQIYVCENGTIEEKLAWFRIINIAGEVLTPQELRNAFYTGEWLISAKRQFSKTGCKAYSIAKDYMKGSCIRQEYLETALDWISMGHIDEYMNKHRFDKNADELWTYFQKVIDWVEEIFVDYHSEMEGLPWGHLYNRYKDVKYDPDEVKKQVDELMEDDEIKNKKGIFEYVLSGCDPKFIKVLNLREFDKAQKKTMYARQKGICPVCKKTFKIEEMDAHHIKQWTDGGKTEVENGVMLCRECHHNKTLHLHHN